MYYLLYADNHELPSNVAINPEEPSLGRIRVDSVAPPHSLASIKRCIARVEGIPELVHADVFADISCDTPLKEGRISILRDGPGLSPNKPMAIVQTAIVQVPEPSKKDKRGKFWPVSSVRGRLLKPSLLQVAPIRRRSPELW